ncbi:receptor-interacting serine/threonine-protein kinase 1 [Lithobates pipiens]
MDKVANSADMSLDDIHMRSDELLDKKEIDCGGFGKVYLCCHKVHRLVVLKTVFTGCKQEWYKNDLIQEGRIMCKLNHERVVKLLGVILEDGNYSLVIEYMSKGNLLNVLKKQIEVPISLKARFILEIIEGMIYLHNEKVIHKDLKPENILADDNFHVKIADLGVAAFQKWSTLTKEETSRQRSKKNSTAKAISGGTISYMAPEHFKDINQKATKKSDVYSFAIVIWVILSNKEPYENVFSNAVLSLGVKDGQRPSITADCYNSLKEAAILMEKCWKDDPDERPSFEDCEKQFRPVYCEKYEKDVERDVDRFQKDYPKPEEFIQRMASLQIDCDAEPPSMQPRDTPQSLHSNLGFLHGNINENLFRASNEPEESEEEKYDDLQRKLQEEMNYHQTGSRIDNVTNPSNPGAQSELRSRKVFNEPCDVNPHNPGNFIPANGLYSPEQPTQGDPGYSYMRNEYQRMFNPHISAMPPATPESGAYPHGQLDGWQSLHGFMPYDSTKVPVAESERPILYPHHPSYAYASDVSYTGGSPGNTLFPKGNFGYPGNHSLDGYISDKAVNLTISNSRAIQIGNGNYMAVAEPRAINSHISQNLTDKQYQHVFEDTSSANDYQLQLLRDNLSRKWKEFARKVGFRQPEIDEIDHDYERDGLKEKVFQMLHKWQMKVGSKYVTVGEIAKALHDLGEKDLLNQLFQMN